VPNQAYEKEAASNLYRAVRSRWILNQIINDCVRYFLYFSSETRGEC